MKQEKPGTDKKPHRPLVVFDYGEMKDSERTRGDVHGVMGVARVVADILGGDFMTTDEKSPAPRQTPDLLFSPNIHSHSYDFKRITFRFDSINESLKHSYSDDLLLVANSLTPETLDAEGKKFDLEYPDLPRPLIMVNLITTNDSIEWMVRKKTFSAMLADICGTIPACTVFMIGCWRTDRDDYNFFREDFPRCLTDRNLSSRVTFRHFELNSQLGQNQWNPYKGLLARADHVIVGGESQSMATEPLTTGKTAHLYQSYNERLQRKRLVHDFTMAAKRGRFFTRQIKPLNGTRAQAEKIVKIYRERQAKGLNFRMEAMPT